MRSLECKKKGSQVNTTVKKIGKSKVELNIQAGKEIVEKKYEEVYTQIGKEAKISGFRPGKVPRDIIKQRFHEEAKSSVMQGLLEELYKQAVDGENIAVINHPEITDVDLKNDSFSFKAVVEVRPEVKINKYKGIKIKREKSEVGEDKINEALDNIKKERKADALDDNFAKSMGYPALSNFKEVVKNQLFISLSENARRSHEAQVVDYLVDNSELDVPPSIIEREYAERIKMLDYQMAKQGINPEDIQKKKKESDKGLREAVAKDIKVYFILDKIASLENIEVDSKQGTSKVMELLLKEAKWSE
ncbi:MAG TPA: hypothetical protein ENH41_04950 [Candidatus Omnitrophica bacterium]|nr:hypothetical protein [Candidatus Omnitrophota bacterium]